MSFGPVVGVDWLKAHLGDGDLRPADCRWYLGEPDRGREAYRRGHIPGAVFVSLEEDLSAADGPGRHPLPSREAFAATLEVLGIDRTSVVVAYDDAGGAVAARLWWMMRWVGHGAVAVLDGGITAWERAGGPVTTDIPAVVPAGYEIGQLSMPTLDRGGLQQRLDSVTLIDARAEERYRGEVEPIDPVAGHIPTARNAPYRDNLNPTGRLRDPGELRRRYGELVTTGTETVVYCGSGVTACHDILAMEHAGLPTATLYPGSWSDWSADPATPKVT